MHDTRILSSKFIARFSVISPRSSRIGKFHIEIGSERILYAVSVRFFLAKRKLKMRENGAFLDVKRLREGSLWIRIISEHACACPVRSASKQGNNKIESYFSRRPTIGLSPSKRRLRHCRRHGRAMHRHFYSSYFSYFPRVSRPRDSRHTR